MADDRKTIRLDSELLETIAAVAREEGCSESDVIRDALRAGLRKRRRQRHGLTLYERAKRAGIIGAAKGLPRDLSTNKRYLKDFGRD